MEMLKTQQSNDLNDSKSDEEDEDVCIISHKTTATSSKRPVEPTAAAGTTVDRNAIFVFLFLSFVCFIGASTMMDTC